MSANIAYDMLNRLVNIDTNIKYILILRIVTTRVH
eukprot:COSAG01_NODE_75824_length_192_cov_108.365591_1_plen_34_part_10